MKKISDYLDNKKIIIAILLVASIFTLLICSKNSPLYPYNDWLMVMPFLQWEKVCLMERFLIKIYLNKGTFALFDIWNRLFNKS